MQIILLTWLERKEKEKRKRRKEGKKRKERKKERNWHYDFWAYFYDF